MRLPTRHTDLLEYSDRLAKSACYDVCMESTYMHWVPIHNVLEITWRAITANTKYTHADPRR